MEILVVLIPISVVLVLIIIGLFAWAMNRGQFEDVEREGLRILQDDHQLHPVEGLQPDVKVDADQAGNPGQPQ